MRPDDRVRLRPIRTSCGRRPRNWFLNYWPRLIDFFIGRKGKYIREWAGYGFASNPPDALAQIRRPQFDAAEGEEIFVPLGMMLVWTRLIERNWLRGEAYARIVNCSLGRCGLLFASCGARRLLDRRLQDLRRLLQGSPRGE